MKHYSLSSSGAAILASEKADFSQKGVPLLAISLRGFSESE
jgi:hypothetical protein